MPNARRTSTFAFNTKSVGPEQGDGAGLLKALVSVFGNVDTAGDVVMAGAFSKSLARWQERGDPIPLVWSHDWSDPYSHIGEVKSARETSAGLEIDAQLDLDNPKAAQIHKLMRSRRLKAWSFAYDVLDATPGHRDGKAVQELRELDILEVGPTLLGVNRQAELLDVKSDPAPPLITPAALSAWVGTAPQITPAALTAWLTGRSPR